MKITFDKEQWKELITLYNFKSLLDMLRDEKNEIPLLGVFITSIMYISFLILSPLLILLIFLISIKVKMKTENDTRE